MPVVRRIRRGDTTISVESHAEILFMPEGEVWRWKQRLMRRIRAATIRAAPSNKRPRWAHYGKPLKTTIHTAKPNFWGNGRDKMRIYGAVGSNSPYAYYVNEGTGVYAGKGPYPAKILPPWRRGDASLYEHTWRPTGPDGRRVAPVMIKGQRPQGFMDKGLAEGFASMRLRSYQVAGEGRITDAIGASVTMLDNFSGATEQTNAFVLELALWRMWRDEAWEGGRFLGRHKSGMSWAERQRWRTALREYSKIRLHNIRIVQAEQRRQEAIQYTREAAAARDAEHRRKMAEQAARKAKGKAKRERDDAAKAAASLKSRQERSFRNAQKDARRYLAEIRKAYPDASIFNSADRTTVYVRYTTESGEVQWITFGKELKR